MEGNVLHLGYSQCQYLVVITYSSFCKMLAIEETRQRDTGISPYNLL